MLKKNSHTDIHNHKVLNGKPNETDIDNCNCRNKDTCLLPGSYQTKTIIYQVSFDCDIAEYNQKCYLGSRKTKFKDRFGIHQKLFNHIKHRNDMELSKNVKDIMKGKEYQKLFKI